MRDDTPLTAEIARVADALRDARRVLFVTGAGLSADSGLPTYRGIGGLYDDRATEDGMPIEQALSGEMLRRDPAVTWRYVHQIEAACRGAGFNRGHEVIAAFEQRFETVTLTQNVDGLHQAAGSRNVIDIHGDLHGLECMACDASLHVEDYAALEPTPRCADCGAVMRPRVVLFGELLPFGPIHRLEAELERGFDAVISVGTTSVFPYIARPVVEAARAGRLTVEINPGRSSVSHLVRHRLAARAAPTLDALWARLQETR